MVETAETIIEVERGVSDLTLALAAQPRTPVVIISSSNEADRLTVKLRRQIGNFLNNFLNTFLSI